MAGTTEKRPAVERAKPPEMMAKVGNPIFGWLLRSPLHGLVDEHLMLLHFRGRKTGRGYTLPVGRRDIDGRLGVLTSSGWRVNFRGGAPVEVTVEDGLKAVVIGLAAERSIQEKRAVAIDGLSFS